MKSLIARSFLTLFLIAPVSQSLEANRQPRLPDWVEEAMTRKVEYQDEDTSAAILHQTSEWTVSSDGRIDRKERRVISIIKGEGRKHASAFAHYEKSSGKVLDAKAWLILPNGEVKEYNKKVWSNIEPGGYGSLFNESRQLFINLADSTSVGSIFAYEFTTRRESLIPQNLWFFNDLIPVAQSELKITLPQDWDLTFYALSDAKFSHTREGNTYIWRSGQHAGVPSQYKSPPLGRMLSYIGITYLPSSKDSPRTKFKPFNSWQNVGAYMAEVGDPKARYNDAIKAKAIELTADCSSDWERIQALTRYVQTLNYISVTLDLSKGGGYTPNDAALVFERHYGDCKDMTTLLRALLESVGLSTYSVTASINEDAVVNPDWPSPIQFNHCIAAVRVANDFEAKAVVNHPDLGRLLFIDPTDSYTPAGRVSRILQGSYCLIDSPKVTSVTKIPEAHEDHRNLVVDALLDANGNIRAKLVEEVRGGDISSERHLYRHSSKSNYFQTLDSRISSFVREASIESWNITDDYEENLFGTEVEFTSRSYARLMGRNFLVLKPLIISRSIWAPTAINEKRRKLPVEFKPDLTTVSINITLPEGYVPDEMPPEVVTIEEDFASYRLECKAEGNVIIVNRTLTWKQYELPAEEFSRLRKFTDATSRAEQTPVVLKRVPVGVAAN